MNGSSHQLFPDVCVLVVEDNKVNQKVTIAMLKHFGIVPDVAANGEEAVMMAAQKKYDLILMDCLMPIMNGYDATIHIRNGASESEAFNTDTTVPILAMTASASANDIRRCKESGMNDVITKPTELDDMAEKLEQWCKDGNSENKSDEIFQSLSDFFLQEGNLLDEKTITELYEVMGKDVKIALDAFAQSASQQLEHLSMAVKNDQAEELKSIAHNLKGMSANIGALQMSKICKTILTLADYGNTLEIEPYLKKLAEHYKKLQAVIKRFIKKYC